MASPIEIELIRSTARGELKSEARITIKLSENSLGGTVVADSIIMFRELAGLPDNQPTEKPNVD